MSQIMGGMIMKAPGITCIPMKRLLFRRVLVLLLFCCVSMWLGCSSGSGGGGGDGVDDSASTFSITGTVSGDVAGGVAITLSGSGSGATTTDSSGNYSFTVEAGTYTVAPSKTGYTFSPSSESVSVSNADVDNVDFVSAGIPTYTLSGTVSGDISGGVTITLSGSGGGATTTDSSGNYSFTVEAGTYTVRPSKTGYTFSPAGTSVSIFTSDALGTDFVSSTINSGDGVVLISLLEDAITVTGAGATADASKVTITNAGTYSISGKLANGQVIVDTQDAEMVQLILNGVNIACSTSAPIYIASAEQFMLVLADGTENSVTDGTAYVFETAGEDEPNAAIFSKADLTIGGNGALTVDGNYNDGIGGKDGLTIESGDITVTAKDDGIRGKDYVIVNDGAVTVNAGGDGVKSDNDEDTEKGYVAIDTGVFDIVAGGDAIKAETRVTIKDGDFTLSSGGGSNKTIDDEASAKGIKGLVSVVIDDGSFSIDAADDAIHSNGSVAINGGTFAVTTGDDGVHADASIEINGGDIGITKSYEGIESAVITINGGDIHITASDDGINVAGGNDGSGMTGWPGRPDDFTSTGDYCLYINGGYVVANTVGDGIDVNGAIVMTGGDVIVNGPTNSGNGALDYDRSFQITGGFLLAVGSAGMAQAPDNSSTQFSGLLNLSSSKSAGTLVHLQTSGGQTIFTFSPAKPYQSVVFSSPELIEGGEYEVYLGGSTTGTAADGLYQGDTYTPGTKLTSFTVPAS